jgi:outer membrane protein assembly factor BamB
MWKLVLLSVLFSVFTQSLLFCQEFSEWRGLNRTGVYSNESDLLKEWPTEGPELLWYHDSIPKGYAAVAVANGLVYTTGAVDTMDVLMAFDQNGKVKWNVPYGRRWDSSYDESRSTPTVEGQRIYVSSGLGDIACLHALTGEFIWQLKATEIFEGSNPKFGISESLLIVDDKVIYTPGGNSTTMVALDKLSGKTLWKTESLKDDPSYASPLLIERNGRKIISTITTNYFFGVEASTGEILWKFDFGKYAGGKSKRNNQTNTPLYHEGCFYLTSGYDHKSVMLKLADDDKSVSVKWVDSILDVHYGGVVLIEGYIYGANWLNNRMGNWVCLDWKTGKQMYNTEWYNKGAVISAEGMLYCYDEKYGNVALVPVNPEKFEVKSTFKVPYGKGPHWAHPVIKNGVLYIRHENALMAYDIHEKQ